MRLTDRRVNKIISGFAVLLSAAPAAAQVQQIGNVTPGHATSWVGSGLIGDGGTATAGSVSSLGLYGNGGTPFCISSSPTPAPFTGSYWLQCEGVSSTTGGGVSLYGPSALPWAVTVNGSTALSVSPTGVTIPGALTAGSLGTTNLSVAGNATVGGTLGVTGNATFNGALTAASFNPVNLSVASNATVGGTLAVAGSVNFAASMWSNFITTAGMQLNGGLVIQGQNNSAGTNTISVRTAVGLIPFNIDNAANIQLNGKTTATGDLGVVANTSSPADPAFTVSNPQRLLFTVNGQGGLISIGSAAFGGALNVAGGINWSAGGTNAPGSIYADGNFGGLLRGLPGGVADIGLETSSGQVGFKLLGPSSGVFSGYGELDFGAVVGSGKAIVLSGSTSPPPVLQVAYNVSGSQTTSGNTSLNFSTIGSASDTAKVAGNANTLYVVDHLAAGWQGSRVGVFTDLSTTAATTGAGNALIAEAPYATAGFNMGGTNTGAGSQGSIWGINTVAQTQPGATFMAGVTGVEIDVVQLVGSNVQRSIGQQIVHQGAHGVQGQNTDGALVLVDQITSTKGWRNGFQVGDAGGQWPIDPAGYIFATRQNTNEASVPSLAAGGIDLNSATFTGIGYAGGGFILRGDGVRINPSTGNGGSVQAGFASLTSTSTGASLDTNYQQTTGTPTVAAGGAGWGTNDVAVDGNGNVVLVTATGGAVVSVSVVKRGWSSSPPANPVAFTGVTTQLGVVGTGLTLNLTWTPQTTLSLNPSGGIVKIGAGGLSANGTPGVSCAAGTVSLTTLVVTSGIVTHC